MQIFLFCMLFICFAGKTGQKKGHPVILLQDALFVWFGQKRKIFDFF